MKKRLMSALLALCMLFSLAPVFSIPADAATSLPNSIYLKQQQSDTCTLACAAMLLRAKMYVSNNSSWSSITEAGIRSVAWKEGEGLYYSFSYSISGSKISVNHERVYSLAASALKSLLDRHPEGIILYVNTIPHAVFVTDYEGDTFYCADPASNYSGKRIALGLSSLSKYVGNQQGILNATTDYWYVSSSSISPDKPGKPVLKDLRDKYPDGSEILLKCDSVTGANQYMFTAEKKDNGSWKVVHRQARGNSRECPITVSPGEYRVRAYAYNTNAWMPDGSDYLYTAGDYVYFTVAGAHTCDQGQYVYYWKAHPHYSCYRCSICGEINPDYASSNYVESCTECNRPDRPFFVNLKSTYREGEAVTFTWIETDHTTHDNFWLWIQDENGTWEDENGHWTTYEHTLHAENGKSVTLPVGKYRVIVQAYNSKFMESDNSDYLHSDSAFRYFEVLPGLTITSQPKDASGVVGQKVSFGVTADGNDLSYQWQYSTDGGKTWQNSSSTNKSATCTLASASRDGWLYRCIVRDGSGNSVTSDTAKVIVNPAVTTQPKDASGKVGEKVTFTIAATGKGLTYQWQYSTDNGKTWNASSSTSTTATCTLSNAGRDGWLYRCVVKSSNGKSVTSSTAKVVVKPVITAQPKNASGRIGDKLTFTVGASGSGLSYQWQYSTDGGKTWKASSSKSASATCTLTTADRDGWLYRCIVKDSHGAQLVSSAARVTVKATITAQPKDAVGSVGQKVTFTVSAAGKDLTYQWQYSTDGGKTWKTSSASGATATCTLTTAERDGWIYRCVVTDAYGNAAVSKAAKVIVKTPLKITSQPKNYSGPVGDTAKFTVSASGTGLTYQWQYSDDNGKTWRASSSKSATATCAIRDGRDGWLYRCVITDAFGEKITSSSARLLIA